MAELSDIASVLDLMPGDEGDWDETRIETHLDSGKTVPQVMQLFWEGKASKLYSMIDVSESGSSRSMSRLYDNAVKLAEYWAAKVAKEKEDQEAEEEKQDQRIRFNRITRV
jgi:hypothetical protein